VVPQVGQHGNTRQLHAARDAFFPYLCLSSCMMLLSL
jgi:hypothetical protein